MNLTRLCLGKPCRRYVRKERKLICRGLGCPQPAFQNIRKGYSETLLAGVIGTFEEEFLEPCSSYNSSANAWCDSSYSHSYRQYLHFMLGVDVDEISNFSDIL